MCRNFEVISGKKSRKSVDKLEGLTKMYRDAGMNVAIVKIPVDMLEIDYKNTRQILEQIVIYGISYPLR